MKIIKVEDLCKIENPTPDQPHRPEIKLDADGFKNLGGMFGLLIPQSQVPYQLRSKVRPSGRTLAMFSMIVRGAPTRPATRRRDSRTSGFPAKML